MSVTAFGPGSLADLQLDPVRWDVVSKLAQSLVDDGTLPAIAIQITRGAFHLEAPLAFGRQRLDDDAGSLRDDAIFLVASITKPVVAMAVLNLIERGELALNDRVVDLLPEFAAPPRRPLTVRNLLTHTSGLPDMLPNNRSLRASNSPLSAFFDGTCAVTLDFPPGHGVQYQSMGFVLLAEILQRVSGRPYQQFLQQELFDRLGMQDSCLGAPATWWNGTPPTSDRIVEIRVPEEQRDGIGWNWNSHYWRQFGAPWGGMLASTQDIARFCRAMLVDEAILSRASLQQAASNQLLQFASVPEVDRRTRPWGLGWRLNWLAHPATFGDLLGPEVIGHWGATGTLCWLDRSSQTTCVILTSQPLDRGRNHLVRLSNAIVAACR